MTKERPILFNGAMVRSLLASTKTQTRRVVKPQPFAANDPAMKARIHRPGVAMFGVLAHAAIGDEWACPYGQPGDQLWVRETFSGPHHQERHPPRDWHSTDPIHYWADGNPEYGDWTKPRPGMFMPRWASRITLEVTEVRVERLQDISEADALAEGIVKLQGGGYGLPAGEHYHHFDPRQSYLSLWGAINGEGSVESNPWVWAVSFRRLP
jgi:hypothetical protein